jgi:hypothetical protein
MQKLLEFVQTLTPAQLGVCPKPMIVPLIIDNRPDGYVDTAVRPVRKAVHFQWGEIGRKPTQGGAPAIDDTSVPTYKWIVFGLIFLGYLTARAARLGFNWLVRIVLIQMAWLFAVLGVDLRVHDHAVEVLIPVLAFRWVVRNCV